jgi:hypothetical protein
MERIRKLGRTIVLALMIPAALAMGSGPAAADEDPSVFAKATSGYGSVGDASQGDIVKATAGYGGETTMDQASTVKATSGYGAVRPTDGEPATRDPNGTFLRWVGLGLVSATLLVAAAIGGRRRQRRLAIA